MPKQNPLHRWEKFTAVGQILLKKLKGHHLSNFPFLVILTWKDRNPGINLMKAGLQLRGVWIVVQALVPGSMSPSAALSRHRILKREPLLITHGSCGTKDGEAVEFTTLLGHGFKANTKYWQLAGKNVAGGCKCNCIFTYADFLEMGFQNNLFSGTQADFMATSSFLSLYVMVLSMTY